VSTALAKPSDAEKAKTKLEKKLDAFEKTYDSGKDLSRKSPEKLDKDIAELDELMNELKALDAGAASELSSRRDALVNKAKEGVSSAAAGKADEAFNKHFTKYQESFDPEKKKVENIDAATIKRAKDELERDIAKIDEAARKPYQERRDALFAKLAEDMAKAKLLKQRGELVADVPVIKAIAGMETIAPMKPTWCEGLDKALAEVYSNYHVGALSLNDDPFGPLSFIRAVTFSCLDPDFDIRQKWVAAFRQTLANKFGLSAALSERLMKLGAKLAVARDEAKQLETICEQIAPLAKGPSEERYTRKLERMGLACRKSADEDRELRMNAVDVPNGVGSQLAGAVLANRMTTQGFHTNDGKLTGFAVANAVINFDAAKFESELAAMKLNDVGTINAVMTFYGMAVRMKVLETEARARNAAVLIDAPKKGVQAFIAGLGENQASINFALAMEDQLRSGNLKGCGEKIYPDLVAAVKTYKGAIDDLRLDGLLAYKLTLCGRNDTESPVMESVFGYYAERSVPVRGPFTAAYMALLDAHNSSSSGSAGAGSARGGGFDPRAQRGAAPTSSGPFVPDSNPIEPVELDHNNTMNPSTLAAGVVKSVDPQGALTKITFRTERYMVPVLECQETNKIDRIASDGTILYRSICKTVGQKEVESTNEPISVPKWAAHGVSAGSFLKYSGASVNSDAGQAHRGWIIEAYESKAQKKRTSLFGIAQ
jgi:hypothetical protein